MIEAGAAAPDFSLSDQDGATVSLKDLEGQYSVLVFFPAAFSPVCTDQLSVYEEVLPDHVLLGYDPARHRDEVPAGMFVGWVHAPAAACSSRRI